MHNDTHFSTDNKLKFLFQAVPLMHYCKETPPFEADPGAAAGVGDPLFCLNLF
jgi:hypothetical protein